MLVSGYYRGGRVSLRQEEKKIEKEIKKRSRSRSRSPSQESAAKRARRSHPRDSFMGTLEKQLAFPSPSGVKRSSASSPQVHNMGTLNDNGQMVNLELPPTSPSYLKKRTASTASTNASFSGRNSYSGNNDDYYSPRSFNPGARNSRSSYYEPASPAWGVGLSPRIGSLPSLPPLQAPGSPRNSSPRDSPLTSPRTSPRNSPRVSAGSPGGLLRSSSNEQAHPITTDMRAKFRNKLLDVLENPDEGIEQRWSEFVDDIIQLGPDSEAIYDLYQVPITRRILEKTEIGKVLQSEKWKRITGASRLVQVWRNDIKRRAAHALALEGKIFNRYQPKEGDSPIRNATWKYTHDVREILSLLKKDYNNQVRRGLNNGSISPTRFLDDFYTKPELFESPKVTSIRRKSKEAEDMERLDLNFPNFDGSIGCGNCKGFGAYYKILALDEQNFSRQVRCKSCQHEWRIDE